MGFFFFKQKTAYEMRISDWSSDVCSSDLVPGTSRWSALRFRDRSSEQPFMFIPHLTEGVERVVVIAERGIPTPLRLADRLAGLGTEPGPASLAVGRAGGERVAAAGAVIGGHVRPRARAPRGSHPPERRAPQAGPYSSSGGKRPGGA